VKKVSPRPAKNDTLFSLHGQFLYQIVGEDHAHVMAARATRPPATPPPDAHVARSLARHLAGGVLRAPSLIITVWGDSIAPHGGAVLLPGLIRLLRPFGLNERLVRTSVFRLVRDGWLAATPIGRRSLYALTPDGRRRFAEAHRRIYTPTDEPWDDTWELVLANGLATRERHALAQELRWAGYGNVGAGVFGRPAHAASPVPAILNALALGDRVVVLRGTDAGIAGARSLGATVGQAWDLAAVAALYRSLLRRFGTVIERFRRPPAGRANPEQCFVARTLMIHEYRRALLRDPKLPPALLPLDWPGAAAYALCADLYRLTLVGAEGHLAATLEGRDGPLPPATDEFEQRFGGLSPPRGNA
jgi:phenylacetic acid degradation operon negative regulatory protein